MNNKYPSHRFHPTLGPLGFVEVQNEDQDAELEQRDELFRDTPYSEAECAAYMKDNPKAKRAQGPTAGPPVEKAVQAQGMGLKELQAAFSAITRHLSNAPALKSCTFTPALLKMSENASSSAFACANP